MLILSLNKNNNFTCRTINSLKISKNIFNSYIVSIVMSKPKATTFLSSKNQVNKISESDLIKELKKVNESNQEIRRSFKTDSKALSFRAGR